MSMYDRISSGMYDLDYAHALAFIEDVYGVEAIYKGKSLRKFGRNEAVGTSRATVMDLPSGVTEETLPASDQNVFISSTSASDTQDVTLIEGHTSSGGDLTFATSSKAGGLSVSLTGQTGVDTGLDRTRVTRVRLETPAVGTVYIYDGGATTGGVPDDATTVRAIIKPGELQTQKCSTSISSIDYWVITSFTIGVLEKSSAYVQARVEIKQWNGTQDWYPITEWESASSDSGTTNASKRPALIVPANHDVRVSAIASGANIDTIAGITGYLAADRLSLDL